MPGADSGWKPPARAAVHPRHVPPCTLGMAATRLCRGARRRAPSPATLRHGAGGKSSYHAVRCASKPKLMLAVGGDFSPSVKAMLQPGPHQRAACTPARKAAGRQEVARREGGWLQPGRPPSRSPPPTSGLGFPGGLQPGRGVVCGFPEVWGLTDFRDLFF